MRFALEEDARIQVVGEAEDAGVDGWLRKGGDLGERRATVLRVGGV